ncbi:hypothetical protein APC62_09905 [Acinetobacter pittii]|uniref:hypothetical protein n=1 Tax=Acinetobacter pittii TaxID=48296 RepID=UPI00070AE056|nr:hypothetical protein [Acinetobacter pittii]KRI61209.1 hypothetical protein APC62_09905 [Acinetobacter pittii]
MSAEVASITSALIQGWFSFVGALLGALALIGTVWFGAKSAINAHKADKLAEAKRDIYLELVRKWQKFLITCHSYRVLKDEEFFDEFFIIVKELTASLHESSFISDPNTKEKIMNFTIRFSDSLKVITLYFRNWYDAVSLEKKELINNEIYEFTELFGVDALLLQSELRKELGLREDEEVNRRIFEMQKKFSARVKADLK